MATKCYICIELTEEEKVLFKTKKQFMGVYCSDYGHVLSVGKTLINSYNKRTKVIRLLKHGSMISLYDTIKATYLYHYRKKDANGIVEDNDRAFFNLTDINTTFGFQISYVYVYRNDKGWEYYERKNEDSYWKYCGLVIDGVKRDEIDREIRYYIPTSTRDLCKRYIKALSFMAKEKDIEEINIKEGALRDSATMFPIDWIVFYEDGTITCFSFASSNYSCDITDLGYKDQLKVCVYLMEWFNKNT